MKRTNQNRLGNNCWWWGFVSDSRDLAFFIDSKTVVFMYENGDWKIRTL